MGSGEREETRTRAFSGISFAGEAWARSGGGVVTK